MNILRWGPAISLMSVIYMASDTPAERIPDFTEGDVLIKKISHGLGYGLLALAFLRGIGRNKRYSKWMALTLTFVYALSDESHQIFSPGRTPSLTDILIDTAGGALALLFDCHIKIIQDLVDVFLPSEV